MKEEKVILVDAKDTPIGTMEKIEAHKKGLLHRAFSIFIVNAKGELLLQQRALRFGIVRTLTLKSVHQTCTWSCTCPPQLRLHR